MAVTDGATSQKPPLLARIVPVLVGISLVGMLVLIIGDLANATPDEGNTSNWWMDIAWLCFSIGGILALVTGILALVRSRNDGTSPERRAGMLGVGWFLLAIIILVTLTAIGFA